MTDNGTHLTVDAGEATIAELLAAVRKDGRTIRILSHGEPIAEMTPVSGGRRLEPINLRLKGTISPDYDPFAGVSEEDWPSDLR